jgi:hypothetical protein
MGRSGEEIAIFGGSSVLDCPATGMAKWVAVATGRSRNAIQPITIPAIVAKM